MQTEHPEAQTGETELMARHGITRVATYSYRVGDYRYTSLGDALAEAERMAATKLR